MADETKTEITMLGSIPGDGSPDLFPNAVMPPKIGTTSTVDVVARDTTVATYPMMTTNSSKEEFLPTTVKKHLPAAAPAPPTKTTLNLSYPPVPDIASSSRTISKAALPGSNAHIDKLIKTRLNEITIFQVEMYYGSYDDATKTTIYIGADKDEALKMAKSYKYPSDENNWGYLIEWINGNKIKEYVVRE